MSRRLRTSAKVATAFVVTSVSVAWLLRGLDLAPLTGALVDANRWPLVLAFALALTMPLLRGARLAWLLPSTRRPRRGVLSRVAAEVLFWNFVLPLKLGELSFPWLLHRRVGLSLAEAAGLFLFVRLVDLASIAGLLALAAVATAVTPEPTRVWVAAAGAALLAAPIMGALFAAAVHHRLPVRWSLARTVVEGASHARSAAALAALMLTTLAIWVTHAGIAWLAMAALGAEVHWREPLLASSAGNLAFALPVNGALGLGPQQVAYATAAEAAGLAWSTAVAAALLTYVVVLSGALLMGVAALFWRAPAPGAGHGNIACI